MKQPNTNKIKPCPYCGSKPDKASWLHLEDGTPYYAVVCPGCCAKGPDSVLEKSAIILWNSRDVE